MTEATHTSEAVFGLLSGIGRGAKLWAGNITVSDAETIDTGLDSIAAVVCNPAEASASNTLKFVLSASVSGGTVTFDAVQVTTTEATDANRTVSASTDTVAYMIVVGYVK